MVLPRAFATIARQRSAEAFAILAVLAVLAAAWLAQNAGLSPALGAFMVGVLLSGSPFHHQIAAEVTAVQGPAARPVLHLRRHVDRSVAAGGAVGARSSASCWP